jgi:mono/diheme cytochrome c family protein
LPSQDGALKDNAAERGKRLFAESCAGCHGFDGKNVSISGNDLATIANRQTVQQLEQWIRNPAPPMPKVFPEPMTDDELVDLHDIATFLHQWHQ